MTEEVKLRREKKEEESVIGFKRGRGEDDKRMEGGEQEDEEK